MKKVLVAIMVALMVDSMALADQLKVTVDVSAGNRTTEVVGADIYANIDGKLTEVTVAPDGNVPFKMNLKAGALRLKSFWITRNQLNGKDKEPTPVKEPEVTEAK